MVQRAFKSTIKDVAQACGVSLMTVSHVINDKPGKASAETRDRILKAMRELDYQPSAIARGLTRRKMDTIGVVFYTHSTTPLVTAAYFGDILGGLLHTAMLARQSITLFTEVNCTDPTENLSTYCDGRCDGLIFAGPPSSDEMVAVLRRKHTPFVFLGDLPPASDVSCVDVDNVASAVRAVEFLMGQGHRRIAFLGGDPEVTSSRQREQGYRQALSSAALAADGGLILPGRYSSESGHQRTLRLMQNLASQDFEEAPTALFCANDEIAVGAMSALSDLGLRVPEDVSIIGFDDSSAASAVRPALTTIRQPFQELARHAVELLLAQIQNRDIVEERILLPTSLVVRDTVSAPNLHLSSTLRSLAVPIQKGLHS